MKKYLIKRLLMIIPTLFVITFITYMIMDMAPGDPTLAWIDFEHNKATPEVLAEMREKLGLDKPFYVRYFKWLGQVLRGNLGYSMISQRSVVWEVSQRINVTIILCLVSLLSTAFIGIALGIFSALKQYKWQDMLIQTVAYITMSIPQAWICLLLLLVFSVKLGWFPSSGLRNLMLVNATRWRVFADKLRHVVLPLVCMTLPGIGGWIRYQRGAFLDAKNADFVRTARSKGLSERTINWKHILRNASLPTITSIAVMLPSVITSSTLVESVFGIPGLGGMLTSAVSARDYTMTMASLLILGVLTLVGILLSDILYAVVDPRIRYK